MKKREQTEQASFGVVGLGKMGGSLALQAREKGLGVAGFSPRVAREKELREAGVRLVTSLPELVSALAPPRKVFLYVPAGDTVDSVVDALVEKLEPGDVVLDGGNSYFRDSIARQKRLAGKGIGFVDCGSSGGPEGARHGGCFMVGGERRDVARVEPILRQLAVPEGFIHAGAPGSGHFVKLVHNAIEFGMLQAIGEGVALLRASGFTLDLPGIFHNWSRGSVIRGWLVELMERGLRENPDLLRLPDHVEDTGEVNWILEDALHWEVPTPAISAAVMELFASRNREHLAARSVALLRHEFGGHPFGPDEAIARERRAGRGKAA